MQLDMIRPPIIGIAGPKGSGKDMAGSLLLGTLRGDGVLLKFAGPLKSMTADFLANFGVPASVIEDPVRKEEIIPALGVSARAVMITLGTEWGRNLIHTDVWVKAARVAVAHQVRQGFVAVFTDVRFDNEARMIRDMGGVIWEVERPGVAYDQEHASEQGPAQNLIDFTLHNDGDREHLSHAVERLWAESCRLFSERGVL